MRELSLKKLTRTLENNPLTCECTNRWIQLSSGSSSFAPKWPKIITSPQGRLTCNDQHDHQHLLIEFPFERCGKCRPEIRLLTRVHVAFAFFVWEVTDDFCFVIDRNYFVFKLVLSFYTFKLKIKTFN